MKILTANIKDNPDLPAWQVKSDIKKIWKWRRLWMVACWQEIGEKADHRAVGGQFSRARGFRQLFVHRDTPISVRRTIWAVVDSYWVKTHGGRARVTPTRGYSVGLLKNRAKGHHIAIINTHFISGAWYGKHTYQKWRKARWNEHFNEMQDHITSLNKTGWTVVVMGDWNRKHGDIPRLTPSTKLLATNGYYDHIYVCPSSTGVKVAVKGKGTYTKHLYTDHNPVYVNISLSK